MVDVPYKKVQAFCTNVFMKRKCELAWSHYIVDIAWEWKTCNIEREKNETRTSIRTSIRTKTVNG